MIIAVEEICFEKISGCLFHIRNSKGKIFGIKNDCRVLLNDKPSTIDEILPFFKSTYRTIAEAEFSENEDYHPHYINFMALE